MTRKPPPDIDAGLRVLDPMTLPVLVEESVARKGQAAARLVRTIHKRRFECMDQRKRAIEHLDPLPGPGESLHLLMDAGRVRSVLLNVSTYFRASDREIFADCKRDLVDRGQRVKVTRSHAKLLLFDTASRAIVVETSANLRSSQNWEQAVVSDDRALLAFHRAWIEKLHEETADDGDDEGSDLPQ